MRFEHPVPAWRLLVTSVCLAALLEGCGGGGGGGVRSSSAPATPPVTPPATQTPIDIQLTATHADSAHAHGFTGQGVTIGVVDSGVMRNHPMLAGRVTADLLYVDPATNNTNVDDVIGHGTWVSEVAAGRPFGGLPGGVAPGANIVSARLIDDVEPKDDGSGRGNKADSADPLGQINDDLIAHGVKIINNSWGGVYWDATNTATTLSFRDAYDRFVNTWGGLAVFAAGNESRSEPSDVAQLPTRVPTLAKGWIAVVAVDSNNTSQLASYSNACGTFNSCLAAPGTVVVSGKGDSLTSATYGQVSGTSFAAPQVSGAAALVWQAFPYFTNEAVRQTILGTATDIGATGPDTVFGYGLLNAGKAVDGPGNLYWGDLTVGFSGTSTWNNELAGPGSLRKQGPGTLILAQPSTFSSNLAIEEGVLVANSLVNVASVGISSRGTLAGAVQIGSASSSVYNEGQLVVAGGDTTIGGSYAQQGGRLSLQLGSVLHAKSAILNGGDLYILGASPTYVVNAHTNVIVTTDGLLGAFSAFKVAPSVFLTASLNYDALSAWLNVQQVQASSMPALNGTPAMQQVSARMDAAFRYLNTQLNLAATPVNGAVTAAAASIQQTPTLGTAQASLQSLTGQLHAASLSMVLQSIDAGARALSERMDALSGGAPVSGWSQDLGYRGSMVRGGYGAVGMDMSGWMAGQDYRQDRTIFGFGVGTTDGMGRQGGSGDWQRSRTVEGGLYAGMLGDQWYGFGRAAVGSYHQTMHRDLYLGELATPVGNDGRGRYETGYAEGGVHLNWQGVEVTPFTSLQYTRVRDAGFSEQGGYGLGLKVDAHSTSRLQAGAGLRASHRWAFGDRNSLRLEAHGLWQRALATQGEFADATFSAFDQWLPLGGIGLSRRGSIYGTGLAWEVQEHTQLQISADHMDGDRDRATMASLSYRHRW